MSEEDINLEKANPLLEELFNHAKKEGSEVMTVCAKIEEEIAQLDEEEREEF